jgi:hypothetical protein
MQYHKPKPSPHEELFKSFIYDDFNWTNSSYNVYRVENGAEIYKRKLFWTPDKIKNPYSVNSMGYRSDEFVETRDIIFAGCSQTWGEGVVSDGIWGNILSKSLNKKSYNLGMGSKSTQFIVKNTIAFCKQYGNPKAIFCLFPEFTRIEMISDGSFMVGRFSPPNKVGRHRYSLVPQRINPEKDTKYSKAPHLAEDMIPSELLFSINLEYIHMIELYCKSNNIKLFWGTWNEYQDIYLHRKIDSMDFKNYVYLEQDKWSAGPNTGFVENFYDSVDNDYMIHKKCHEKYRENYGMNFDFPMDGNPKSGLPGVDVVTGHMAVHRHLHISEKFEEAFKNAGN